MGARHRAARKAAKLLGQVTAEYQQAQVHAASPGYWPSTWDGETYAGGMGPLLGDTVDYSTLRNRSIAAFRRNSYARGVIRRLLTNVISTGLEAEVDLDPRFTGLEEDAAHQLSREIEARFALWAESTLADLRGMSSFYELQYDAYLEALTAGDVLIVQEVDPVLELPRLRLITSERVASPRGGQPKSQGNRVVEGVELDKVGRHCGYWVVDGEQDVFFPREDPGGRRVAWLVYGSAKRHADVRGEPILSTVLQKLEQISKVADAAVQKAQINASLALIISRTADYRPSASASALSGGGRGGSIGALPTSGNHPPVAPGKVVRLPPGAMLTELERGEMPTVHSTQASDTRYGEFEAAILNAIAWSLEIPGEVLQLVYRSSYSAARMATEEFRILLNRLRDLFGVQVCDPVYREWLLGEALSGRIEAPGLLQSLTDRRRYVEREAWFRCGWAANIRPGVDPMKDCNAMVKAVEEGLLTRADAAKALYGKRFETVIARLGKENALLAEARAPLSPLPSQPVAPPVAPQKGEPPPQDNEADDTKDDDSEGE